MEPEVITIISQLENEFGAQASRLPSPFKKISVPAEMAETV